ncbi:NAD(P)-dependent oxidoreductase [Saccharomonospora sp. NPDC046836]|uniref:NAD(P)-dependent oxidoreductase n=1 Tax=Saccharomonospora sp. NPDC046836 TaxID=3156921 RepID=UPI0033E3E8E4
MTPAIGYIGLGNMGGALARRLHSTHPLAVYDRDPRATGELATLGATVCADPAEVAKHADTIFLCLPTSEHVRDVLLGSGGLAGAARPGTLVVDQTTGDPAITRALSAELADRDVHLIDAPVSGGTRGAENGTIAIMVGADEALLERVWPVLTAISPNVHHAGGVGTGHTIKLVNNLLSCTQRLLTMEVVSLAAANGMDPSTAVDILLAGGGRNAYLERVMGPEIVHGRITAGFTLGLAHKDVRLACQLGSDSGVPLFYGNLSQQLYQSAISALGRDAKVDSAVAAVERLADTMIMPADAERPAPFAVSDGTAS